MSFAALEKSIADGAPVRLYLFELGGNQRWAYCTADRAVSLLGITYQPAAISDDGIRMTGEASADTLRITAPVDLAVAVPWRTVPPSDEVFVTIRDTHHGLGSTAADSDVVWVGAISGVRWPQDDRCELSCETLFASMRRPGLKLTYQRSCPHSVYDAECRVSRVLHAQTATITSLDGAAIVHNAAGAGTYAGGFIEWQLNGRTERRGIDTEAGQKLTLLGGTAGLAVGGNVTLYPGCDGTSTMCQGRFANMPNYGGFRHMPGKSPFDGDPVF